MSEVIVLNGSYFFPPHIMQVLCNAKHHLTTDKNMSSTASDIPGVTPQSQIITSGRGSRTGGSLAGHSVRSRRKHTPYMKSATSRRLAGVKPQDDQEEPPDFEGFLKKTWRLYKMTPMYNFSYDNRTLRRHSAVLSAFVEAESLKGAVVSEGEVAGKAVISVYRGLRTNESDSEAIQILVKSKPSTGQGEAKVAVTAVLFGAGVNEDIQRRLPSSFTWLPLMMVKGPVGITSSVQSWLQSNFDCHITPMEFTSTDLSWMVAMWAGVETDIGHKPVELLYRVPQVEGLSSITYTINAGDCKALWDSVHTEERDQFTVEEVEVFTKALESHFYAHFNIFLGHMHLSRAGTGIGLVSMDGKVKLFQNDHVLRMLSHFTQLATEQLDLR
ncbi:centromere protein L-like isoform X1 [Lingula anatina]|uniref:Centromere protein L n=2 Tax=Lingula anatina TaxID=7574 RepID=A0A1S3GZN3_LINAN|nr:centromere protein L-like isoform X1 [Lingula anatina]|eukprot:XP_013379335.1 centromere protein L-like isoform X1 [Lingula anatina]